MTDTAQACGNCKWFKRTWPKSVKPELQGGSCKYKLKGPIPIAYLSMLIKPDSGKDCPTWHAK